MKDKLLREKFVEQEILISRLSDRIVYLEAILDLLLKKLKFEPLFVTQNYHWTLRSLK